MDNNRISWESYFMAIANMAKLRSKDPITKVGSILVKDKRIISMGYNGFPIGCEDEDYTWDKDADDITNTKNYYVVHSELNCILGCKGPIEGSTLYVTLFPCNECAKAIIQSGIKKVIYQDKKSSDKHTKLDIATLKMFKSAGVEVQKYRYIPTNNKIEIYVNGARVGIS